MSINNKLSDAQKKKIWQAVLVLMLILEIILIAIGIRSLIKEHEGIDFYQAFSFIAIAIWIYIAYLKQRNIDISHLVVDEKIKTHSLVENLKEGVILTDSSNTVLLVNSAAGRIIGCDTVEMLGKNLAQEVAAEAATMLESGQDGAIETSMKNSSRQARLNVLNLSGGQSGQENCKLVYVDSIPVSVPAVESPAKEDLQYGSGRCAALLLESAKQLAGTGDSMAGGKQAQLVFRIIAHSAAMMRDEIKQRLSQPGEHGQASPGKAMSSVLSELKTPLETAGITMDTGDLEETLMIGADEETLIWVFRQFLCEALLNTDPGAGPVIIRLGTMGSDFEATVFDRGPAVPADSVQDLFASPYSGVKTGDGSIVRKEGSGLGLVRMFADALGGTVIVESPPKGGLRVTLHLPV